MLAYDMNRYKCSIKDLCASFPDDVAYFNRQAEYCYPTVKYKRNMYRLTLALFHTYT
jgi:hypothetical protein